jgi:hypothetical protein
MACWSRSHASKSRQLQAAQAHQTAVEFVENLYGGRQFGIRDLNGYILYFISE